MPPTPLYFALHRTAPKHFVPSDPDQYTYILHPSPLITAFANDVDPDHTLPE